MSRTVPRALRHALEHVAAAGETEYLATLEGERLATYARDLAADAHDRGATEILASDFEDLAAWLRQRAPLRDAITSLMGVARSEAHLRQALAAALGLADGALALLEDRRIAPARTAELRAAYRAVLCLRGDAS